MTDRGDLPRELLHLAVLQLVTRSVPFTHAHSVPVHALSHLCSEYLQLVAAHAQQSAEHAGRRKATVWDVAHALHDLAPGSWPEMRDQVDLGDSGDSDGELERIRQLAHGFRDLLHIEPPPKPIAHLHFGELLPTEVAAINDLTAEGPVPPFADDENKSDAAAGDVSDASSPASAEQNAEPKSPPPQQETVHTQILTAIGDDDVDMSRNLFLDAWERDGNEDAPQVELNVQDGDERPELLWKNPDDIPAFVPPFLPPFPGMERETAAEAALRRRKERDMEAARAEARAADGRRRLAAARGNPWAAAIPYASSMLAELHPASALPPASPPRTGALKAKEGDEDGEAEAERKRPSRRRARSISPPPTGNSLVAFRNTLPEMPHLPTWLRPNPKRRTAASTISLSTDLAVASPDSLFGLLPVPATRQATRPPGFLPDYAPTRVHPFNTPLPYTISNPVPYNSAAGHVIAPPPHPRIPDTLPRLRQHLAAPTSNNLPLFSRTTRVGPPGPLGPKGEALDYEYVGDSAVLALNVEWPIRAHNAKLPSTLAAEETPAPTAAATPNPATLTATAPTPAATTSASTAPVGIKLKLGKADSASASPAPVAGPSIVVNGSPAEASGQINGAENGVSSSADVDMSPADDAPRPQAEDQAMTDVTTGSNGAEEAAAAVPVAIPAEASTAPVTFLAGATQASAPEEAPQAPMSAPEPRTVAVPDRPSASAAATTVPEVDMQTEETEGEGQAALGEQQHQHEHAQIEDGPKQEAESVVAEPKALTVDAPVEAPASTAMEPAPRSVEPTPQPEPQRVDSVPAPSAPPSVQEASASTSRMSSVEASPQPVKLPSFKIRFSSSSLGTSANAAPSPSVSPAGAVSESSAPSEVPASSASPAPASLAAPRPSLTLKLSPRPSSTSSDQPK
ncbi:hypothetical protein ACM66B_006947 [Microbotryomycetes sp. NB124-2]